MTYIPYIVKTKDGFERQWFSEEIPKNHFMDMPTDAQGEYEEIEWLAFTDDVPIVDHALKAQILAERAAEKSAREDAAAGKQIALEAISDVKIDAISSVSLREILKGLRDSR